MEEVVDRAIGGCCGQRTGVIVKILLITCTGTRHMAKFILEKRVSWNGIMEDGRDSRDEAV